LQQLVDGKQTWAVPLDADAQAKGFLGWHQRGYLPHYDAPGITQIITLRLADSLPASRRGEWEHLLCIEYNREPQPSGRPASSRFSSSAAASRARRRKLEEYLDRGWGECWLRQPAVAKLTEEALRFFDGQRYQLQAWVVMPNHVHVLVDVWETPLAKLVQNWKSFVAGKANQLLGRSGAFWEREYMDTVVTNEKHRQTAVRYIENNPVKGGLVREGKGWPWSSARLRDESGRLSSATRRSADVPSA
jgi:REP element-mobilizing transposase RayT